MLTYFNTILLPLTLVTGFFGMNVDFPFAMGRPAFWAIVGFLALLTAGLVFFFNRRTRQ